MAGDEHQRERVVEAPGLLGIGKTEPPGGAFIERPQLRLALQEIERLVPGGDRQPRCRLLRHAAERPARQGRAERVLNRVLDQLEARGAEETREPSGDLAGLAPEEV